MIALALLIFHLIHSTLERISHSLSLCRSVCCSVLKNCEKEPFGMNKMSKHEERNRNVVFFTDCLWYFSHVIYISCQVSSLSHFLLQWTTFLVAESKRRKEKWKKQEVYHYDRVNDFASLTHYLIISTLFFICHRFFHYHHLLLIAGVVKKLVSKVKSEFLQQSCCS